MTTDEFIAQARAVHGDRYGYEKTAFSTKQKKVTVTCGVHGDFDTVARCHLAGSHCLKCSGKAKKTADEFTRDARAVHANRYDYSRVAYKSNSSKVEIGCAMHGPFFMRPITHIQNKAGCPSCAGVKRTTLEDFITRAHAAHGDRYDYSKVEYRDVDSKVTIICREHGEFSQIPYDHWKGRGCVQCGIFKGAGSGRKSWDEFIGRARAVHGDEYDYSRVNYTNTNTHVEIVCKTHGAFLQKPTGHLNGNGCPTCAGTKPITKEEFMERARVVHGERYDYRKMAYSKFSNEVEITCNSHGSFWQMPKAHTHGSGCPACAGLEPVTRTAFIARAIDIHGDQYDYSKVKIKNTSTPVEVICKAHGPFLQRPTDHLNQEQGCPECAGHRPVTKEKFLERANDAHGDRYDYSAVDYKGFREPVEVVCHLHGAFYPSAQNHAKGSGCPICAREKTTSIAEKEIGDWVASLGLDVIRNDREAIDGLEIDIFVPSKNFGVEYNGAYWHSDEKMQHPRFHELKAVKAENKCIRLVTVWDYDWANRPAFVKAMILHQMEMGEGHKLNARSCTVSRVDAGAASAFYERTHIQGKAWRSIASYGLFSGPNLVACMSFSQGSSRRGKSGDEEWELTRFSTDGLVRGGASKLFAAFTNEYDPQVVWSFSDRQHFSGGIYPVLGFVSDGLVAADYRVHHQASGKTWHKSAWQRKHIPKRLVELGIDDVFDPATDSRTERDMQARVKALRIMDAGKVRWKWQQKSPD